MDKTSTLIYSIHNLASKAYNPIIPAEDFDGKEEFADVYQSLQEIPLEDVKQEIVDNIMNMLDDI